MNHKDELYPGVWGSCGFEKVHGEVFGFLLTLLKLECSGAGWDKVGVFWDWLVSVSLSVSLSLSLSVSLSVSLFVSLCLSLSLSVSLCLSLSVSVSVSLSFSVYSKTLSTKS